MHTAGERQHTQGAIRFVELREHQHAIHIARVTTFETDAAARDLLAEHIDLLTDHIVHAPHQIASQPGPRVDRDHRRNVVGINPRHGLLFARTLHLQQGQNFVARQILRREHDPRGKRLEANLLIVATETLVLNVEFALFEPGLIMDAGLGDVRSAESQLGPSARSGATHRDRTAGTARRHRR